MKFIGLLILFVLVIVIDSFSQNNNQISWSENCRLEWSDFKGKKLEGFKTQFGVNPTALSALYIEWFSASGTSKDYTLCAYFDMNRSWSGDTTDLLLEHEQIHFDIYELYARKMRKVVDSLRNNNVHDSLIYNHDCINELDEDLSAYSHDYDKETRHGLLNTVQKEWKDKVLNELYTLKKYALRPEECQITN